MELVLCAGFILTVRSDGRGINYYFLVVAGGVLPLPNIPQDRQNKIVQNLQKIQQC